MKRLILCSILLIGSTLISKAQSEFKIHSNGLMYDSSTMSQLKYIVDSLNLKFKTCSNIVDYKSKLQAKGKWVSLKKGNLNEAS